MTAGRSPDAETVLVCGVGAFGQAVLSRLRPFAVPLHLIDLAQPDWRNPELQLELQGSLTLGDMRRPHILRQAGVEHARAVLLLSSDGGTNIEAALQVRLLNTTADIVIRSSRGLSSLGTLLQQRLPRLAVVDPLELSAGALVQALRPGPQLARFRVHDESFEVREGPLEDQRYQRPVRLEGDAHGESLVVMPLTFYAPQARARSGGSGAWQQLWRRLRDWPTRPVGRLTRWLRNRHGDQNALLIGVVSEQRGDGNSVFVANRDQAWNLLRNRAVRAVALLSGQLLTDLQDTLELQSRWPEARFALLAPGGASLISPLEIGADVAVATAFGERVEGVWRVRGENLLQVRYEVSTGDGLVGRTRSRLEHGYGLTVLCLLRHRDPRALAMPAPGTVMAAGDQVVVLATLAALRRVELGHSQPEGWSLSLSLPDPLTPELRLTVQHCLARHLAMTAVGAAQCLQDGGTISIPVDPDSGALVERDLHHQGVRVEMRKDLSAGAGADGPGSAPARRGPH